MAAAIMAGHMRIEGSLATEMDRFRDTTFSQEPSKQFFVKNPPSLCSLTSKNSSLMSTRRARTIGAGHKRKAVARVSENDVQTLQKEEAPRGGIRFRPCIDIHQGKVKQIVGSTLQDLGPANATDGGGAGAAAGEGSALVTNFESTISSAEYAEMYRQDDLPGGHVIMLGADRANEDAAMAALGAYPGGLQVGGGINSNNARKYLDGGASHVIVTSYVFRDGRVDEERLQDVVKAVGKERLVLDLSCRKRDGHYYVVTDRWQRFSDVVLSEESLAELARSADEFLVHGVDVEGMRLGVDNELVELLGRWSPCRRSRSDRGTPR